MKLEDGRVTTRRMYEIVGFDGTDEAWDRPLQDKRSVVGCIVQWAGRGTGFIPVAPNKKGRAIRVTPVHLGDQVLLRPLNHKDQKKIEDAN